MSDTRFKQPSDPRAFTETFDRFYTRFASLYDLLVRAFPVWKRWLRHALPHVEGPRVLEVSFGTGWLLTQIADRFEVHGIDLNARMTALARRNLRRRELHARLARANVEALPYADGSFQTVVNTMAFSGYPDAEKALGEMLRVLDPSGRLVILDVNHPKDGNWLGTRVLRLWERSGDLIRDLHGLLRDAGMDVSESEIGGWGSVHLYVATRRSRVSALGSAGAST